MSSCAASARTRSNSRPGERNHGATTMSVAPRARNDSAASARLVGSPVANTVVEMGHWAASARVRVLAVESDDPTALRMTPGWAMPSSVTRRRASASSRLSAPSTHACITRSRAGAADNTVGRSMRA
ncbi:Uncharacterised protein [Mycobacteroides abscessus]|nr:Uncharacterised protein [Mycobacteroides abscessus]SHV56626.1 Uncharacterised protein [Mycobacteroides abscessus subsp. abscessus]